MDENETIAAKAHEIWESEGRPQGRSQSHWEQAKEIVALREGAGASALKPVEETVSEPVEPASIVDAHGEVPGLTDLGDETSAPSRQKAASLSDETPVGQSAPAERRR